MQGVHDARRPGPARRGRQGDHAPDARDRRSRTCGSTPGTSAQSSLGATRFPTILASRAAAHGVDPVTELIPVAPACHYASRRRPHRPVGPVGRRRACTRPARSACSGVHGANRLASNSLLEGLVFSRPDRPSVLPASCGDWADPAPDAAGTAGLVAGLGPPRAAGDDDRRGRACCATPAGAGRGRGRARPSWPSVIADVVGTESWEATNLLTISTGAGRRRALARRRPAARTGARTSPSATTTTLRGPLRRRARCDGETRRLVFVPTPRATDDAGELRCTDGARARPGWTRPRSQATSTGALAEDVADARRRRPASATIPAEARGTGVFAARERRRRGRARRSAAAGLRRRRWATRSTVTDRVADGTPVEAGDVVDAASPARPAACSPPSGPRSTSPATSPEWPPPPPPGSTPSRAPARRSSTPARRCPAGARCRSTPSAAAAASNHRIEPVRRGAWSRTTTWSPRAASCRRTEAVRASATPTSRVEVEVDRPRPAPRAARRRLRTEILLDNMSTEADGRGGPRSPPAGPTLEASGGLTFEPRPRGRRHRRRLHLGRRAHPLGEGLRHRPGSTHGGSAP